MNIQVQGLTQSGVDVVSEKWPVCLFNMVVDLGLSIYSSFVGNLPNLCGLLVSLPDR